MRDRPAEFVPEPYQEQGIALFMKKAFAGLFWPPGLGKTAVALFAFHLLRKAKIVDQMYVFSTKKVITNTWPREIRKWLPQYGFVICRGKGSKKRIEMLEMGADIVLINNENVDWFVTLVSGDRKKIKKRWQILEPERPDLRPKKAMLVVDESSKFRNHKTARFKAITRKVFGSRSNIFLNLFKRRYILTGSPAPKGLLNLWAQLFIVDLGETLGEFVSRFQKKYFFRAGFKGHGWELKPKASKEIYQKVAERILRVGEGALKLPPLVFRERFVDMEPDVLDVYQQMERQSIIELEGETITAANAGVKTQKLRQLANGFVYAPVEESARKRQKRKSFRLHLGKAEEVYDLVEETQGVPALIGYYFDSDLDALLEVFGEDAPVVTAGTSDDDYNDLVDQWNAGELPYLIAQENVIAWGQNLQDVGECSVIYYTIPWDLEVYEQFYRRVWRKGQKHTVMVYHVLARDTVDDLVVLPTIQRKDRTQRKLLDYLEKFMTRRKKFTRATSLTKVGNKEGMEIIYALMKELGQKIPVPNASVKDTGGVLVSAIVKQAKDWRTSHLEDFCKLVTKNPEYDGKSDFGTVKKMIEEIFCLDIEKPVAEETWKMWPGYSPKAKKERSKKMATKKASKFAGKKASKKASKKAVAPKKTAKKKTASKKASKKAAAPKKTAKKKSDKKVAGFNANATYVRDSDKTPRVEVRAGLVDKVDKAKGRGVKGSALSSWIQSEYEISDTRAEKHIAGCVGKGFITEK